MWVDTMFPTPIENLYNDLSDTDLDYYIILTGQKASFVS